VREKDGNRKREGERYTEERERERKLKERKRKCKRDQLKDS
jgi:hypothetical protein